MLNHFLRSSTAPAAPAGTGLLTVHAAHRRCETEVLAFLAERPVHTVIMSGLIRDNGIISSLNRGQFHLCRDWWGRIESVALIGHLTLVEARSEPALIALARGARNRHTTSPPHMMLGEQEVIGRFWRHAAAPGSTPRRTCSELLFERCQPPGGSAGGRAEGGPVAGLRPATPADLPRVMRVHVETALAESGINPLEADPEGFRVRTLRRIEQRRVWVLGEGERLIFKADIAADTPEAVYLEGIYVDPRERGKGWGTRCLAQLNCRLLERVNSICLLVNEQNIAAHNLYRKVGYTQRDRYQTLFV